MVRRAGRLVGAVAAALASVPSLSAQAPPDPDAVLARIEVEATTGSQVERLAQVLLDSLGPRLTGTPGSEAASDWVIRTYREWGIDARRETYGTWLGWRRGLQSIHLVEPRTRALEATLLAWSPGTGGVRTGPVVRLPEFRDAAHLDAFLAEVAGRFVLLAPAEPSCRPDESWAQWARPETLERARAARADAYAGFVRRLRSAEIPPAELIVRLEAAGAAGLLTSRWAEAWGTRVVHDALSASIPSLDLSCEDYGLVWRLAAGEQGPVLRVEAEAERTGEVPVWNTLASIPGRELPDEYVVLSAHFDSWDAASGATDNGTGTVAMMEAMRILSVVDPEPRRTILVGHWNGEEQGLNGSRAFAADHPEVVQGLQALFNQDEGTGRVARISMQGLESAGASFRTWFSRMPPALVEDIELIDPGVPSAGGSDESSFVCAGAPAFRLSSLSWDYGPHTWHTDRDSYDKVVLDELRSNAMLIAMLAHLASEDPRRVPRIRAELPIDARTGQPTAWPACQSATRSFP